MLSGGLVEEGRGAASLMGLLTVALFVRLVGMVEWWVSLNTCWIRGILHDFVYLLWPFARATFRGFGPDPHLFVDGVFGGGIIARKAIYKCEM